MNTTTTNIDANGGGAIAGEMVGGGAAESALSFGSGDCG